MLYYGLKNLIKQTTILDKTFADFFTFSRNFSLPQVNGTRFYHQKVNVCVGSRVAEQLKT